MMKKAYVTPDIDLIKLSLKDVILASPTEGTIPVQGNTDTVLPDDELDL